MLDRLWGAVDCPQLLLKDDDVFSGFLVEVPAPDVGSCRFEKELSHGQVFANWLE